MILIVLFFLIISNAILLVLLYFERKYSKTMQRYFNEALEGWHKESEWWKDVCGELSEEIIRLRDK